MSTQDLSGKIALVTGASRGIGAAIADTLAAAGAKVIGTATSESGAAAISERLAQWGGEGRALNSAEPETIENLIADIEKEFGKLDILVNNAGITRDNLLMRMKEEEWDDIMQVNLKSVFRASKAVLRGMMKQRAGRIINITSVVGVMGNAKKPAKPSKRKLRWVNSAKRRTSPMRSCSSLPTKQNTSPVKRCTSTAVC